MTDAPQRLADLSVLVFVVSSMLALGMSQRLADVAAPLRRPRAIVLALAVNFVLSPLLALGLIKIIPLQPAHATGLLLLSAAAGAPFLPKLAEICGGNLAYSVALMLLLMGASTLFMPSILPLIAPGLQADPWTVARPLLVFMLLPLGVGFALALGAAGASWLERLLVFVRRLSNLALVLLVVLFIGLNLKTLLGTFGSFAIATYALYLFAVMAAAYLLGAADAPTRNVFALAAGCRNLAAALVIARANSDDPAVTVMLIVAFAVSLVVLLGFARAVRPTVRQ
jgi:BASS family bile acid:Na+ symporter